MLRLRHLGSAIATALVFSAAAHAGTADFDKVVVFGDSLSDNGNLSLASGAQQPSRFTTNPGEVAVELLANRYGLVLTPSLVGGTDFAFGGAGVISNSPGTPAAIPTITDQVQAYMAAGAMNSRTLYTMWGGANDIFYHATATAAAGAAQQLIEQLVQQQIQAAIAANPALVGNSAALAALTDQITAAVTQQVVPAVLAQAGVAALETPDQAQAAIAAAATQEVNLLGQMHAAGAKYVVVFNLPDIGSTPSAASQGATAAEGLSGLSMLYNGVLGGGLDQLSSNGLNVVPVNVYALFNEVLANPSAFGFSNVTTPACLTGSDTHTNGLTSVQCGPEGSGAPYTYAPGTEASFLFADGVHPTTAAHAMVGQYVVAELSAPGAASMLAEVPVATADTHLGLLQHQMQRDIAGASTRAFAGISYGQQRFDATTQSPRTRSRDVNLAIGVDAAAGDQLNLGVALGLARSNADVGSGGFQSTSIIGSGYALWHGKTAYLGANIGFGQLDFNNVTRRFQLGALQRVESGTTAGNLLTGGVGGGLWFGDDVLRTGPFAQVQWQRIRVDGYSEDGSDSTAMWFGHQQRTALLGTIGWQLKGSWKAGSSMVQPFVRVAWNHDDRAQPRKVRAGLTGMQGTFALTGFIADDSWASADAGLSVDFGKSVSSWIAYRGQFGNHNHRADYLNLGVNIAF